jgi:hypothetical protein
MVAKDPREGILEALRKHPEGLTIVSLAGICGLHRHTCTKYVYELMGAGIVYQREIGPAKLCHLREKINSRTDERKILKQLENRRIGKKSQMRMFAVALFAVALLSSVTIASNYINETSKMLNTGETVFISENDSIILILMSNLSDLTRQLRFLTQRRLRRNQLPQRYLQQHHSRLLQHSLPLRQFNQHPHQRNPQLPHSLRRQRRNQPLLNRRQRRNQLQLQFLTIQQRRRNQLQLQFLTIQQRRRNQLPQHSLQLRLNRQPQQYQIRQQLANRRQRRSLRRQLPYQTKLRLPNLLQRHFRT